jgi:hypothetical protein
MQARLEAQKLRWFFFEGPDTLGIFWDFFIFIFFSLGKKYFVFFLKK